MRCSGASRPGRQGEPWRLQFFRNRWIFVNFNVLSKNFQTSTVGKVKGLEFYRKIFELGLPTLHEASGDAIFLHSPTAICSVYTRPGQATAGELHPAPWGYSLLFYIEAPNRYLGSEILQENHI